MNSIVSAPTYTYYFTPEMPLKSPVIADCPDPSLRQTSLWVTHRNNHSSIHTIHPFFNSFIHPFIHPSIGPSIHNVHVPMLHSSINPSFSPSIRPPTHPFVYLSTNTRIHQSAQPPLHFLFYTSVSVVLQLPVTQLSFPIIGLHRVKVHRVQ